MVQKEVGERFIYNNNNKKNRLNLLAYLLSDVKKEFNVSNNVFFPKPKVQSCVISFYPNKKENINPKKFSDFTKIIFFSKRKKLLNNLNRNLDFKNKILNNINLDIDLTKRAEDLNFKEIVKLFRYFN